MKHPFRFVVSVSMLVTLSVCLANFSHADDNNQHLRSPNVVHPTQDAFAGFKDAQKDTLAFTYAGSAFWGWFQDIVVSGNLAYCAAYHGLIILDISDPANPTIVSKVYIPGSSVWHPIFGGRERSIEISGNYVYMTCQGMGLRIIDISSPANPFIVGIVDEFDDSNAFWDIRLSGNYAYVAAEQGLLVIDISLPSNPQVVARPTTGQGLNLAISGSTVYMGNESGSVSIDVSTPESPVVGSSLGISSIEIYVWGTYAYFVSESGRVIIVDISSPNSPVIADTLETSRDLGAAYLSDGILYLGQSGTGSMYATWFDTLEIYDLVDPLAPGHLWTGDIAGISYSNLAVFGDQAFLPTRQGMNIVDISTPSSPLLEGRHKQYRIDRFSITGDYGYFQSLDTFYVVDVTVPSDLTVVGQCFVGTSALVHEIELVGNYAYILLNNCCVKIVDITIPTAPSYVNEVSIKYTDITVRDTLLYGIRGDTLSVFNLADPMVPSFLGATVTVGNTHRAISVSRNYTYVAGENNSWMVPALIAFDITDPTSPDSIAEYYDEFGDPFYAADIQVQGNYAYVLGMPSVMDISDPANPSPLGGSPMPIGVHNPTRELLFGDYLIFVESVIGLEPWFDIAGISDPAQPTIIGSRATVGFPSDAAVKDNYLFLTEGTGLVVREMTLTSVGSGFFVSTLADGGGGSLRAAVAGANSNPGPDTLVFLVSGIIPLTSALPVLTDDGTVILGSTAPGGINSVTLNGSGLASGNGLEISGSDCMIEGLRIIDFPENGIACTGSGVRNTISFNQIHRNDGIAIDLNDDGVTLNDAGDSDTGPNDLLNYPEIDSVVSQADQTYMIYGTAEPNAVVEFFVAHEAENPLKPADPSGHGEAWDVLGSATASPTGEFTFHEQSLPHFSMITMTATDAAGNTSEMSSNFRLSPSPLVVVGYSYSGSKGYSFGAMQNGINIIVEDPAGRLFGRDADNVPIEEIPDAEYWDTPNDSVVIHNPIEGTYIINFLAENPVTEGLYAGIIWVDGSQAATIIVDGDIPGEGQMESYTYEYEEGYMYVNGDANGDGQSNVGDAVFIINYVFNGGPPPDPIPSGDANCDEDVNVGDAVRIINYVFNNGDPPCYVPVK